MLYEAKNDELGIVMLAKFYQDFVEAGLGWVPTIWIEWSGGPSSREMGAN